MIVCPPALSADVESVATPPDSVPVPRVAVPSLNVTVPVGVPVPEVTVAVNVTDCPNVLGFADDVSAVVVHAALTVCVTAVDVLVAWLVVPP